jgi:hypothetical protein
MELVVDRFSPTDTDDIGKLSVNGEFFCYTMENPDRPEKIKGITAIPEGIYKVGRRISPHFGVMVPWILDVPNFQYVLIHWGNTVKDTEGCLIVGARIGTLDNQRAVLDSKPTWDKLAPLIFAALDKNEEVTIKYMKGN